DGIRDFHVTGVQTCALPISELSACFSWLPRIGGTIPPPVRDPPPHPDQRPPRILHRRDLYRQRASDSLPARRAPRYTQPAPPTRSEERRVGKASTCRRPRPP